MPKLFILDIETDATKYLARFRLSDARNNEQLAAHEIIIIGNDKAFQWEALFDMQEYINRYTDNMRPPDGGQPYTAEQLLQQIGTFLGQIVLGNDIIKALHDGVDQRTLLIRLPDTFADPLASAFARVPWEIARIDENSDPLLARNVTVRVISEGLSTQDKTFTLNQEENETVRVLLIFAHAPKSTLLTKRLEREELLNLFYDEILPNHLVQVDVLSHGVTRSSIKEQVHKAKGYHIVHWSAYGNHDKLELYGEDNQPDYLSGAELVDLLQQGGGFIPELVFLSACHSGSLMPSTAFQVLPNDRLDAAPETKSLAEVLTPKGYTSIGLELLHIGVKQVVGMRYAVGSLYARRLAGYFYHCLLATGHSSDVALAWSRGKLSKATSHQAEMCAVDHVTPLLFGMNNITFEPHKERSPQLKEREPKPEQPILLYGDLKKIATFIGREQELTRLNLEWLPLKAQPIAVIQGLVGSGKTALAAEAIHLWHQQFDRVLVVQAKGQTLSAEHFYQILDSWFIRASVDYWEDYCNDEYCRIYLCYYDGDRYQQMRDNLMQRLRTERVLLVIDNFESCLLDNAECEDPEWTALLQDFTQQLIGTGSKLLITTRHYPAVLKDNSLCLTLDTLPLAEARLFCWRHPKLHDLWNQGKDGQTLAVEVLNVSRGHPLIIQRLADLADDIAVLQQALSALKRKGFEQLPDFFTERMTETERDNERQYLEDVAIGMVDWLLARLKPDARCLLWMLTLALEEIPHSILEPLWSNISEEDEFFLTVQQLLVIKQEEPELLDLLDDVSSEIIEQAKNSQPPIEKAPINTLLSELVSTGLIQKRVQKSAIFYQFHELVRERCAAWMQQHPEEIGKLDKQTVLRRYGQRYAMVFKALRENNQRITSSVEAGRRALTYFCMTRWFEVFDLVKVLFEPIYNVQTLQTLITELHVMSQQLPKCKVRWKLYIYPADALMRSGQSKAALPFYQQAATEVENAQDRGDLAIIYRKWATALGDEDVDALVEARTTYLRAAESERKVTDREVHIIDSKLEAYRIDMDLDNIEQVLPDLEQCLEKLRGWWQQYQQGQIPAQAPDKDFLLSVLIDALDIAESAQRELENWQACLALLQETADLQQIRGDNEQEQAETRFNTYTPLLYLGHLDEAQEVLNHCLQVYKRYEDLTGQEQSLSALADICNKRGDSSQAIALERQALAICERLEDPEDRAISHGNLANYLFNAGDYLASGEHRLAVLIYFRLTGNQQSVARQLNNHAIVTKKAAAAHVNYRLASVQDLLKLTEFAALRHYLLAAGVDIAELQTLIDATVK
jgi:hypothetical protein